MHHIPPRPITVREHGFDPTSGGRWASILQEMAELRQDEPTRFGTHIAAGVASAMHSRIDRLYVSWPSWILTQVRCRAGLVLPAPQMHAAGISDHAWLACTITTKPSTPASRRPLQRWLCDSPEYSARVHEIAVKIGVPEALGIAGWQMHKKALRNAAPLAIKDILRDKQGKGRGFCFFFRHAGRCGGEMGRLLRGANAIGRSLQKLLRRVSTAKLSWLTMRPSLLCARRRCGSPRCASSSSAHRKKATKGRTSAKERELRRWLGLWSPLHRKLQIGGILLPDGEIVHGTDEQATALADHWKKVFAHKKNEHTGQTRICPGKRSHPRAG